MELSKKWAIVNMYKTLNKCLCCGSSKLEKFIDLGSQPLANNLVDNIEEEYFDFPLIVNCCKVCWHSQLSISIDPSILFKNYYYVTGTSKTMNRYCEELAENIQNLFSDSENVSILDIACNDGTLLEKFSKYGWDLTGVEPAENIAPMAEEKGIKVYTNFFASEKIDFEKKFNVITALNVFAHVSNPYEFLLECKENLDEDGIIVIQTSQRDMVEKNQFDTVYHEHISFFSLKSMQKLCERAGLNLIRVETPDIHGGSYVFYISNNKDPDETVKSRISFETRAGRYIVDTYRSFQPKIENLKEKVLKLLDGKNIIGFGAAAKGIVFMNFVNPKIEYVIDENPLKQGKYIPKLDIPIKEFVKIPSDKDYTVLVLAWNFFDEIKLKLSQENVSIVRCLPIIEEFKGE